MTQLVPGPETSPRFSIITAVYNVSTYLPAFIASVDAQAFPAGQFEVVAVDDGSTDESLALLRDWERRRPGVVRVLTKENGGQSTARNLGLEVARGEWVTFTDPDDVIEPDYLGEVDAFLRANPQTLLVGTNRVMLNDATGELTDNHPLRMHFREGNRLRNLDELPKYFYGSAPAAFFRLSLLQEHDLRFDPRCGRNFEDGHFCCRYAARPARAQSSASWRARATTTASARTPAPRCRPAWSTPTATPGAAATATSPCCATPRAASGEAPEWLQNLILYELSWYFSSQDAGRRPDRGHRRGRRRVPRPDAPDHPELPRRRRHRELRTSPLKRIWKEILLHSYRPEPWHTTFAVIGALDNDQGLVKVSYHFTGELPHERFLGRGKEMAPTYAKVRDMSYHGRTLLHERVVWLPHEAAPRQARRPLRRPALLGAGASP